MADLIYDDFDVIVNVPFHNQHIERDAQLLSDLEFETSPGYVSIGSVDCSLIDEHKTVEIVSDGQVVIDKDPLTVGMDNIVLNTNVLNYNKPLLNYIDVFRCQTDTVDTHETEFVMRMDIDNFCESCVFMQPRDCLSNSDGYFQDFNIWNNGSVYPWIMNGNNNHFFVCLMLLFNDRKNDRLWICSNTDDWDVGNDFVSWAAFFNTSQLKGVFGIVRSEPKYGLRFNAQSICGQVLRVEEIGYCMTQYASREYMADTNIPLNSFDTSLFHQKLEQKLNSQ